VLGECVALRASARRINAVPADNARLGPSVCSIWDEVVFAGLAFEHDLRILPPTDPKALRADSGVVDKGSTDEDLVPSGVSEKELTLEFEMMRGLAAGDEQASKSLYLKCGDNPWRKATQIPVT